MIILIRKELHSLIPMMWLAGFLALFPWSALWATTFSDQGGLTSWWTLADQDIKGSAEFFQMLFIATVSAAHGLLLKEKDDGTLEFLDSLPAGRSRLFLAKAIALQAPVLVFGVADFGATAAELWLSRTSLDPRWHAQWLGRGLGLVIIGGWAFAGIGLGAFGVVFMGAVPQILIAAGGAALFQVFAGMMVVAALICLLFFANPEHRPEHAAAPFSRAIWFVIAGVALMTFNQAMVFSFVEVIGAQRGFAEAQILAVLIVLGVVNFLVPAPLAALLEKRLSAARVTQFGPLVQAVLALVVTMSTQIQIWAPAAAVFVAVQIFTHTFAFGLLARMDPTGRAVAATPAMLMIGSALGPAVGGALGLNLGFGALGIAGVLVACVSIIAFTLGARRAS